jgi:carboxymethylenebutenolidase
MIFHEDVVDLTTPTGPMRTYILHPVAPGQYPGILFYSEIYQVTSPVRRTAAMLAGNGFVVAVPEVYHELEPLGTVLACMTRKGTDRGNAHKYTKTVAAYDSDARAVFDYLKTLPYCTGKLGTMGICLGGHLAFRAAMQPEALAGACLYATDIHERSLGKGGDNSLDRVRELRSELLMIWGRQDPHIPGEGRALIYQTLTEAGVTFTWHEFNAAHAFIRDEGPRYDPALVHICYTLILSSSSGS